MRVVGYGDTEVKKLSSGSGLPVIRQQTLSVCQVCNNGRVKISTHVTGWLVWLGWAWLSFRMWQIGIRPRPTDPQTVGRRALHIVGAIIFSALALYFLGVGLGFYQVPARPH